MSEAVKKRAVKKRTPKAIMLITSHDAKGLVAAITHFLHEHNGNVLELEQHVDRHANRFFMRVVWGLDDFDLDQNQFRSIFQPIAEQYGMEWEVFYSGQTPRMAILVSRQAHCLYDLLSRFQAGEWQVAVPVVISNHQKLSQVARSFGVNFHHLPLEKGQKAAQEARIKALLHDYRVDFIVLARYMQVLSADFVKDYPHRIINIHHSFLPAFPGARPYHQAHQRGVKIIGATSHYVTDELDAGPIIEQDVARVTHKETPGDMIRRGRDLEKIVLARAVYKHLQRKLLVWHNRTIVFD